MDKLSRSPVAHQAEAGLAIIRSATTILWRSLLVVFATEFALMLLLRFWKGIPFGLGTALLDALLLSVIILPALYLVILRPITALAAEQAAAGAEARFETIARTASWFSACSARSNSPIRPWKKCLVTPRAPCSASRWKL
jgi:hypothetical protein